MDLFGLSYVVIALVIFAGAFAVLYLAASPNGD